MGQVWTRKDWNKIIQRINDLAQNPPGGCEPVDVLPEVEKNHIWTRTDVTDVQDKLIEICKDNTDTFTAELRLWTQDIIDEINEAIDRGWCDCEPL